MAFDSTVAGVTLAGSLLSAIASFCVLACFVFFNKSQRSFRHALVFNLALADFINATDNSVSGIIYVRYQQLSASPACAFNGWLGQLSVQATDFSVLAISMATLLVVTQTGRVMNASLLAKTAMCLSVWIVPFITSTTALAMGVMTPVSGNWCWISASRTDLRYALGHGWRFAIMGITIITYTYIWIYITRHFKSLSSVSTGPTTNASISSSSNGPSKIASKVVSKVAFPWRRHKKSASEPPQSLSTDESIDLGEPQYLQPQERKSIYDCEQGASSLEILFPASQQVPQHHQPQQGITATTTITTSTSTRTRSISLPATSLHNPVNSSHQLYQNYSNQPQASTAVTASPFATSQLENTIPDPTTTTATATPATGNHHHRPVTMNTELNTQFRERSRRVEREIKKMLLLNGYPIAYVVLWIPGITNRIMEATGYTSNNRALAVLQASTQYIGFANAVTYGLNQQWRGR